jgi:hypothetical protein
LAALLWSLGFSSTAGTAPPLAADTPVLTVAQTSVSWEMFHFWLRHAARHYKQRHGLPWDQPLPPGDTLEQGQPLREYLLGQAQRLARQSLAIEQHAMAAGLDLDASAWAAITAEQQRQIRIYTRMEYERIVARMYGSRTVMTALTRLDRLGQRLFAHLYGPHGERCSDADVAAYVAQAQLVYVKYLWVPREQPQAEPWVRALHLRLREAPDPGPLLDAAIRTHGHDATMRDEPDGRLVARTQLPAVLQEAYDALPEGGLSAVLPSAEGFYVLQRLPLTPEVITAGQSLRYWAAYHHRFQTDVARWAEALPSTPTDALARIDWDRLAL